MTQFFHNKKLTIWINRMLRWGLGTAFIILGLRSAHDWYTISFGAIILLTGFLSPRRCMGSQCDA